MTAGLEAQFLKARRAAQRGDAGEARRLFEAVLARFPNNQKAADGLAELKAGGAGGAAHAATGHLVALYGQEDYRGVLAAGEALMARHPNAADIANIVGAAALSIDDLVRAESAFRAAIAADADHQAAHNNLGLTLGRLDRADAAEAAYVRAIALDPSDPEAAKNYAALLAEQGRGAEAVAAHRAFLAQRPDDGRAHHRLGKLHADAREHEAAVECFLRAIAVHPDDFDAIFSLAHSLLDMGRYPDAVDVYHQATLVRPDHIAAQLRLADILRRTGDMQRSHDAFARAHALRPQSQSIRSRLLHQQAIMCDWSARSEFAAMPAVAPADDEPVQPFIALPFEDDPARQRARSDAIVAHGFKPKGPAFAMPEGRAGERIRIGYFSADFHDHATLYLMAGLLREHDRERFEIRAYSFGTMAGGMRSAVLPHFDSFTDIRGLTDAAAVEHVRADRLDVAVDLKGHTADTRLQLFAERLAPVQIAYLGYPASVGGDFMDYMIADPVVLPHGAEGDYAEKIIRIPGSYQANDDRRPIGRAVPDRTALGLPRDGFVFCSFNQLYKVGPDEFDIWMRLLREVDGSVLWLVRWSPIAEENMRREAAARGVDPARLIFADKLEHADHLARQRHADLFLDTFAVNAHTTASDALWGGLPVLTLAGRQFAARVAASLLSAIDLPDLIADTREAYYAKALHLARSPGVLAELKARLARNRTTTALFDTVRHARRIEAAYAAAHRRRLDGLSPDHIDITD